MTKKLPWERDAVKAMAAKRLATREKYATAAVADFNSRYKVGTPARFWPMARGSSPAKAGVTRTAAYVQKGYGYPMVMLTGQAGGMALTHVEVKE